MDCPLLTPILPSSIPSHQSSGGNATPSLEPFFVIGDPAAAAVTDQIRDKDNLLDIADALSRDRHLFNSDLLSDAAFVVQGNRIPVHTHLLRLNSSILSSVSASCRMKRNEEYVIPGLSLSPFMTLLRWIYCRELVVADGHRSMLQVMSLASMYQVRSLLKEVKKHESLIWILVDHAMRCGDEEEQSDLWERIKSNTEKLIVNNNDFLAASPAVLEKLTSFDTLNIRESDLFKSCCKWAIAECKRKKLLPRPKNQRQVMEAFIKQFAFQSMTLNEFVACCSEILTEKEQLRVLWAMGGKEVSTPFRKSRNIPGQDQVSPSPPVVHAFTPPSSRTPHESGHVIMDQEERGRTRKRVRPASMSLDD